MSKETLSAIILKTHYDSMGSTADVEILGKKMIDWVALSLPTNSYAVTAFDDSVPLPILVRPFIDTQSDYTALLYSDTPLMTKKTLLDALATLKASGHNLIKMTRGYIFKTAYLQASEGINAPQTHYFDEEDFITAFSFKQVSLISDILRTRILNYHMERGVYIEDTASVFIGPDVRIAKGAKIGPFNILKGETILKQGAKLTQNNYIENGIIDEGATINSSQIYKSFVGKNTTVGPYAYIRPDTIIGSDCRIGDFVEIKASVLGDGCKVSHLSYVGDAEIGDGCNIGCGVVFVNYDGKDKHKARLGKNVFVGSNVNLIAPITLEDGTFIGAGSTINKSVPKGALAIARAKQMTKTDWQMNKFTAGIKDE